MRQLLLLLAVAVLASACQTLPAGERAAVPLSQTEGEVYVYLGPPRGEEARWTLTPSSVVLVAADGARVALELRQRTRSPAQRHERLLASGSVRAGTYGALEVQIESVTGYGERAAALIPPSQPVTVRVPIHVAPQQAAVVRLAPRGEAASDAMEFTGTLDVTVAERPAPSSVAYLSHPGHDRLTLVDKLSRRVAAVVPVTARPSGIALDARRSQAFVAQRGEDQVLVLDSATGARAGEVELGPRDAPADVALTADRRTLLVVERDADAVSFVDADRRIEVGRVTVREDPTRIILDRAGARAYVFTERPSAVAVIDVASRAVVTSVPLDAEPLWADFDRAGRRLYVVHRGSPHLTVVALPSLTITGRIFVGGSASFLKVDTRTDLVYVARANAAVVDVYEPLTQLAVDTIRLPAAAGLLAFDDVENTLWAVASDGSSLAIADLTSRTVTSVVDLLGPAFDLAMVGER